MILLIDLVNKMELRIDQEEDYINGPGEATNTNNTNRLNNVSSPINTVSSSFTTVDPGRARDQRNEFESVFGQDKDANNTSIFGNAYDDEDVGAEADLRNLETTMSVSPIPTTKIHKDHPKEQIIGDINSATQTRRMIKMSEEHAMISYINKQRRKNHKDYQNCLFACFLFQMEPKKSFQSFGRSAG
ncbi:hypothetical protein Tco_1284807 [Tanacetum coccineum]